MDILLLFLLFRLGHAFNFRLLLKGNNIVERLELPFNAFGPELRNLLTAAANKLHREWPDGRARHPASREMLLSLVLVATNLYTSILYLCADSPKDPFRKPEFALATPPMSRVALEALFTLVFTLDDLESRTEWYHKAGWREIHEKVKRAKDRYGNDPAWCDYISRLEGFLQRSKAEFGITEAEEGNPSQIKRWPLPSRMKKDPSLAKAQKHFLEYLEDWFYRELSQDAHLSFNGLARHASSLLRQMERGNGTEKITAQHKSNILSIPIILVLSLVSEIEIYFLFGLGVRLTYVWGIIKSMFPNAQEIYDMRYADKLCTA